MQINGKLSIGRRSAITDILTIRTLGKFSVSIGDKVISDNSSRSNKAWRMFKYLITYRHKMAPIEALIEILWPEDEPEYPQKSLYTIMSRLRKMLSAGATVGAEQIYILFHHDSYQWNPDVPIYLDAAEFEETLRAARGAGTDEEKLHLLKKATDIYDGKYLAEIAYDMWAMPVTNHFNRLYIRAVEDLSDLYLLRGMNDENTEICNKAISIDPFEESIHERLINAMCAVGDISEAQHHYKRFLKMFEAELGALPSEEFQLSCQSLWAAHEESLSLDVIKNKLDAEPARARAYFCSADTFSQIYQFDSRADERMKFPIFLALITIEDEWGGKGGAANIDSAKQQMYALRQCLMTNLRRGDIVSHYSKNQFLLMLTARLHDEAEAAMNRVIRVFNVKYALTPCRIRYNLTPIGD